MKVLCVYHDRDRDWPAPDISSILSGCEVVETHCYEGAVELIQDTSKHFPSFDVLLTDTMLPRMPGDELFPYGVMLQMHADCNLIRGHGIFVPPEIDSDFSYTDGSYTAFIASRECWMFDGKRDWAKLLSLVVEELRKLDGS